MTGVSEPPPWFTEHDAAVAFLLGHPGLLDTVLDEHVDDDTGYCAACPGPQSGRRRFPCNVRLLAARVERVRVARAREHRPDPASP